MSSINTTGSPMRARHMLQHLFSIYPEERLIYRKIG
ncbi:hypothetical protein FOWG_15106 [Fusarium oxysporum f. sp. lycopersici MN25]|nr:hypothetical protein FOWG_15106 [Fusarium oxysporum f. sp. lycopersici MN25]